MRSLVVIVLLTRVLSAQTTPEIRKAAERALPPLENSTATFVAKRTCFSCHHNGLSILTFRLARTRGLAVDSAALATVEDKTFRVLRGPQALDDAVQATVLDEPTPNDSYLLMAAHAAQLRSDLTTEVYARRIANWQRNGHWVTSDFRPPHSSSLFTSTATAIRAISFYMPEELRTERDASFLQARRWLVATRPVSTEDASFRLMGLVWAGAGAGEIAAARRDLLAMRTSGGAWPELSAYPPDAYSTGEALYALHESGMPVSDRDWRAGLRFLLTTQAPDGTWRIGTRMISPAEVSPAYFTTGFPYGKDEYLSYAGSAWATMALLTALPAVRNPNEDIPVASQSGSGDAPSWARTALFGSAKDLTALLDNGLSPNSRTASGTTLLMMAASDESRVRLLLDRGADAEARSKSGIDALTVASMYRGTASSLRLLLGAGSGKTVDDVAPEDVRIKNPPLVRASRSGDMENVKLLLDRGFDPSDGLSQAVTYGYPDIARLLIAAGASAHGTESSGINLLHWAAITNHPEVIPALVEAGVEINTTDEFGFTPLMYAATIDFGDARVLNALLSAGADPTIRNQDGRTAIEQARYFRHRMLEAALHK
jgi:ankyrin repeat protein